MIMLIFYIGYIVIMKFNKNLKGLISKDDEKDADDEEKIPMNQSIVKNQGWIYFLRGNDSSGFRTKILERGQSL